MTRSLPVLWWSQGDAAARGYWDQAMLEGQLARLGAESVPAAAGGAVVVVPGSHHRDGEAALSEALSGLSWAVVVCTSNEEGLFDVSKVEHPRCTRWSQYSHRLLDTERYLPLGAPPASWLRVTDDGLPRLGDEERPYHLAFLGQVTHERRVQAVDAVNRHPGTTLVAASRQFAGGLGRALYEELLTTAKFVACPSGPVHPETFRMYETIEAGGVPLVDLRTPAGDWSAWWQHHVRDSPLLFVGDWSAWWGLQPADLTGWQHLANLTGAWWKRRKLAVGDGILADAVMLSGQGFGDPLAAELSVIVTMSPIPSHPSTWMIDTTVDSAIEQLGGSVRIVVACDGVRPELAHRTDDYERAVARVLERAQHDSRWANVSVVVADTWGHQANLTRRALDEVHTPAVLFMEHDTPLLDVPVPVPWERLAALVQTDNANVVRLHHEAQVLDVHRYLMVGDGPVDVEGLTMWRCRQWSQRPHVASTDWYRQVLDEFFPERARTMIEDRLHGVVQDRPWEWSKLWMYHPWGDVKRSTHLDGRESDDKFDMRFA